MDEYKGLLKEKSKALNVFEKTRNKLQNLVTKIHEAELDNRVTIADCELAIEERQKANAFLVEEKTSTMNTINKIDVILE